jgi:hypothetical protein
MKRAASFSVMIIISINMFAIAQTNVIGQYYNQWHDALDSNPFITEPVFFNTERTPRDYAEIVNNIFNNKLAVLEYVCDKVANGTSRNIYRDALLIDRLGGVNLFYDKITFPLTTIRKNIENNVPTFQMEWLAGDYKAPDQIIKRLCQQLMSGSDDEASNVMHLAIDPARLIPLRRYGIFALPELIRQLKYTNSKHVFAAILAITNMDEYSAYLRFSDRDYLQKTDKINLITRWYQKELEKDNNSNDIMKKIAASLADR